MVGCYIVLMYSIVRPGPAVIRSFVKGNAAVTHIHNRTFEELIYSFAVRDYSRAQSRL